MCKANLKSGFAVALVSIPLSISIAVVSGVSPIAGIITAIWAGFIGAAFGGSNYNVIGPTGALSGLVASYALMHGPGNVSALAIMTGIFVMFAYWGRLERYLIFIPSSVIHGFILGVACIIILNQLNFALGLHPAVRHEKFIENVVESFKHIGQTSWPTVLIFIIFFLALLVLRRWIPSIPGVVALSPLGIAVGYASTNGTIPFNLETLGSKFGIITPHLFQTPSFIMNNQLMASALVIAFIAIIETMLSAKIADAVTKTRHNTRKEMRGLWLANIASGLMGGIPATAALARTALNIKTGATSKMSAIQSSLFIGLGSFIFLPWFAYMPMAVIAAILVFVAINMVERERFDRLFHHDKNNFFVAMLVAVVTVYQDPIIGVLLGTVMALLLLVNKLAHSYYEIIVREDVAANVGNTASAQKKNICIYAFKGKLVYLNSQEHRMRFESDFNQYAGVILLLNDIYFIDLDGIDALEEIIELIQSRGQLIMLVHPNEHIKNMLHSSKKFEELEKSGLIFDSLGAALNFFDTHAKMKANMKQMIRLFFMLTIPCMVSAMEMAKIGHLSICGPLVWSNKVRMAETASINARCGTIENLDVGDTLWIHDAHLVTLKNARIAKRLIITSGRVMLVNVTVPELIVEPAAFVSIDFKSCSIEDIIDGFGMDIDAEDTDTESEMDMDGDTGSESEKRDGPG